MKSADARPHVRAVLVMSGWELPGIVTDRDIVVRCVAHRADLRLTEIGATCKEDLVTISPGSSIEGASRVMADRAARRLPVIDSGRPVGVVSLGDLAIEENPQTPLANISAAPPNN